MASIRLHELAGWFSCIHILHFFTFPSEKLTGRIVSPSVIHYFIHCVPSTIISLVCLTSRLTDFGCNPVIRCDKCTSFTTFIPKSTVVFFVYSPSQTKLNPLFFFMSAYPLQHLSPSELNWFITCNFASCLLLCKFAWGFSNLLQHVNKCHLLF